LVQEIQEDGSHGRGWGLLVAAPGFGKPQVKALFHAANSARLEAHERNGVAIVQVQAKKAREAAEAARQYAAAGSFSSDIGQRAARSQAQAAQTAALEAEEYARNVQLGREAVQALPDALLLPEFVGLLVRSAVQRYPGVLNVHEAFLWFVKMWVLEDSATQVVDDEIAGQLQEAAVQKVLAAQRTPLRDVQRQYGTLRAGTVTISLAQWLSMLRACGLVREVRTHGPVALSPPPTLLGSC
jgi:hypothetical protein